jgi:hypothetical protein
MSDIGLGETSTAVRGLLTKKMRGIVRDEPALFSQGLGVNAMNRWKISFKKCARHAD